MKKLILASALTAALASVAATSGDAGSGTGPINAVDFESINANSTPVVEETGGTFWNFVGSGGDGSLVQAYGSEVKVPSISGPAWAGRADANAKYLALSTEGGILWRGFGAWTGSGEGATATAQPVPETGLYVDTLVQFTPTEDGGTPELTQDDKLAIWLNVSTPEGSAAPVTNLCVRAGFVDQAPTVTCEPKTYTLVTSNPIEAGKWYRLTVKTIADCTKAYNGDSEYAAEAITGFQIYIDGTLLAATEAAFGDGYVEGATDEEWGWLKDGDPALAMMNAKTLFPSLLGQVEGASLTAVGFKGSGAIDDLVLTTEDPFAAGSADLVQIGNTKYETLAEAIDAAQDGDVLELLDNVTLESGLVLPANAALNLTLDLGGHTVSYPTGTSSTYVIDVKDGNSLTVTNGTITTTGRGAYVEGELILENGANLSSACRTLNIVGIVGNWGVGTVEKDHPAICTIKAGATATHGNSDTVCAFVRGTGSGNRNDYHAKAILNVYGSLVDTGTAPGQYGITGNGGNASIGEINFYDGSVYTFADETRPMMWLPQNDLNLYGGTLTSAGGGILFYCGHLNVPADSTVVVTANGPAGTFTGYSALDYSADALYLADQGTRYPWGENAGGALPDEIACRIDANIAGGTFISANGSGIATYLEPSQSASALVSECVTGGLFSDAIETVLFEEGFKAVPTDNDMYTVGPDALAGTGTEADPFVIDSRRHLKAFRNGSNNGTYTTAGAYYVQTADIDLEGQVWVKPINEDAKFCGNYDGQGHKIENFVLSDVSYAGLFGGMTGGSVKNLQILNASGPVEPGSTVSIATCVGFGDVEPPAGNSVLFENVTVSGTIAGTHNVGGFTAWTAGSVTFLNCTNNVNCTNSGSKVGGFTPIHVSGHLVISNCVNNGNIANVHGGPKGSGTGVCVAGGFAAYTQDNAEVLIVDCVNNGDITSTQTDAGAAGTCEAGAFITELTNGETVLIKNCVNTGAITADGTAKAAQGAWAGAIIAKMANNGAVTLDNVTNDGAVTATPGEGGAAKVGAFVANNTAFNEETGKGLTLTLGQVLTSLDLAPFGNEVAVGGYTATKTEGDYTVYYVGEAGYQVEVNGEMVAVPIDDQWLALIDAVSGGQIDTNSVAAVNGYLESEVGSSGVKVWQVAALGLWPFETSGAQIGGETIYGTDCIKIAAITMNADGTVSVALDEHVRPRVGVGLDITLTLKKATSLATDAEWTPVSSVTATTNQPVTFTGVTPAEGDTKAFYKVVIDFAKSAQ